MPLPYHILRTVADHRVICCRRVQCSRYCSRQALWTRSLRTRHAHDTYQHVHGLPGAYRASSSRGQQSSDLVFAHLNTYSVGANQPPPNSFCPRWRSRIFVTLTPSSLGSTIVISFSHLGHPRLTQCLAVTRRIRVRYVQRIIAHGHVTVPSTRFS